MVDLFSGAVKLADLNDFIAPSQACVVKLDDLKGKPPPSDFEDTGVFPAPKPSKSGWSQTVPTKSEADPVKISLQDCLACSGCVTSAETVLLEHQSTGELLQKLRDPGVIVAVTLSRQSVASIGVASKLTPQEVTTKLAAGLRSLGAKLVLNAGAGQDLALMEAAAEFMERYRAQHSMPTGHALMSTQEELEQRRLSGSHASVSGLTSYRQPPREKRQRGPERRLPMLASACPGWICYAEKTHGDYSLPYISSTKSPQAVMGTLVKRHWARQHGHPPETIYHCAVMPCYDKKLEASRDDFNVPGSGIAETDSVLTTTELQRLLQEQGLNLDHIKGQDLDNIFGGREPTLSGMPGGSGGYLEYIYRTAALQLFGICVQEGPLPLKAVRNTDFREIALEVDGKVQLRFALAYGFRNIQTILRKVKQGLSQYDYIEVMACPSGCINGGGQLPPSKDESLQEHLAEVDSQYHHPQARAFGYTPKASVLKIALGMQIRQQMPENNPATSNAFEACIGGLPFSKPAQDLLHTAYHKRDKSIAASVKDW